MTRVLAGLAAPSTNAHVRPSCESSAPFALRSRNSAIAKERLSLESAIRKVEADAARKSGAKPRETRSDVAPLLARAAGVDSDSSEQVRPRKGRAAIVETESARPPPGRLLRWLTGKRAPSFGNAVSEVQRLDAMGKARERRAGPTPSPARLPAEGTTSRSSGDVKSGDTEDLSTAHDEELQAVGRDPFDNFDEDQEALNSEQHLLQATEDEHLQPLPPRSYPKLVTSVIALFMLAGFAATISWLWPHISELYRSASQIVAKQQPGQAAPQTASQSKFLDRVPQDQGTAQAPSPTAAQRVVLYQEDLIRFAGQALLRLGYMADGNRVTCTELRLGTCSARRCENSRTADNHDLVAPPQSRSCFVGQPHH